MQDFENEIFNALVLIYKSAKKNGSTRMLIFDYRQYALKNFLSEGAYKYLLDGKSRYGKLQAYGNGRFNYKAINITVGPFLKELKTNDKGMTPIDILKQELNGGANPNSTFVLWDETTIPQTWSTGYTNYEIIAFDWGFQLFKDNGRIAPPTQINFGKYATEDNFFNAFNRAMDFVRKTCEIKRGLPPYIHGLD